MIDYFETVQKPTSHPERIVSLSPSNTEVLFAVGAGEKVVGVTNYCNYPPDLKAWIETDKIVRVGGYCNPSVETIVNLKPDLVLVSTVKCKAKTNNSMTNCSRKCKLATNLVNRLKKLGLNVLTLTPHSMNDVLNNILMVGQVCGNDVQAANLVKKLRERIDHVVAGSKALSYRPKVYFEVWNKPYMSANSGTWIGDLIKLAGGTNIFGEAVSEWPIISSENIIQLNPDIIAFPVIPEVPRFWGSFEEVKKRPGWKAIKAVRNGNLYEVPRDTISRPGPRLVDALELLTNMIRP